MKSGTAGAVFLEISFNLSVVSLICPRWHAGPGMSRLGGMLLEAGLLWRISSKSLLSCLYLPAFLCHSLHTLFLCTRLCVHLILGGCLILFIATFSLVRLVAFWALTGRPWKEGGPSGGCCVCRPFWSSATSVSAVLLASLPSLTHYGKMEKGLSLQAHWKTRALVSCTCLTSFCLEAQALSWALK